MAQRDESEAGELDDVQEEAAVPLPIIYYVLLVALFATACYDVLCIFFEWSHPQASRYIMVADISLLVLAVLQLFLQMKRQVNWQRIGFVFILAAMVLISRQFLPSPNTAEPPSKAPTNADMEAIMRQSAGQSKELNKALSQEIENLQKKLSGAGPEAVPELLQMLEANQDNPLSRSVALSALQRITGIPVADRHSDSWKKEDLQTIKAEMEKWQSANAPEGS